MRRRHLAAFAIAPLGVAGCLLITDVDGLSGGGDGADGGSSDGAATGEGGVILDAASDSASDASDAAPPLVDGGVDAGECPGDAGPVPVRVGSYCIDRTEVTNAQYAPFVAYASTTSPQQIAACAWNTSVVPNYGWPAASGEEQLPVVGVDWCDAHAFCRWAGKRLCGAIDGGAVAAADGNDATRDQWYRVCSGSGARAYPYGNSYDGGACNGTTNARSNVGAYPACAPAEHPSVVDLSGNVHEWEDLCTASGAPETHMCRVRGGSHNDSPTVLACTSSFAPRRDYAIALIGFRCCSP